MSAIQKIESMDQWHTVLGHYRELISGQQELNELKEHKRAVE
jgi:hypothetical protein